MKEKILVGMSGGVDSSVTAALLEKQGFEVSGVTLILYSGDNNYNTTPEVNDAQKVCRKLGFPHYTFDFREEFKNCVINDFTNEYLKGATPNPCIVCNRCIKFGAMLEKAKELGFNKIATGHYATIKKNENGRYLLCRGVDKNKDQTYVLYSMTQEQLSSTVFPLGDLTKSQVREFALENGFSNAEKPDSQDICFVPDGDYAAFIENYTGKPSNEGDYVDKYGNVLGKHKGVIRYTVGQRKGLGIALGKPAFVINKDAQNNLVTLGDEEALFYKKILVEKVNFIPFDKLEKPLRVTAKLRYRHNEQPAVILPQDDGGVVIEFDQPQRAPSLGQAAVFYDGDIVVGGGTIVKGID